MWIILLCIIFCILLSQSRHSALKHTAKLTRTDSLLRSSAQLLQASKEETDPILSFSHSSKSSAFLSAARAQMGDEEIESFYPNLQKLIKKVQVQENYSGKILKSLKE